ncbi:hypothetical protein [Homoserinibacter sp. YIM 151385]|uniref:hypothetical protein n=1 Tax=Homoserinibacter sp. YIM 151385 TaxID=2985506 RepID=UPI0022F129E2|nr:hypothetical protein [Homoserinibacter sp. YIM 151385]WBU39142.1 hypothetical protein OF852_06090 [Homoserinibacter sp. YIM 151385]
MSPIRPPARPGQGHATSATRVRAMLGSAVLVLGAVVAAVVAGGATSALWFGASPGAEATISTGTVGLELDGATSAALPGFSATPLVPGQSTITAEPVTLTNTGDTTLEVQRSSTTISNPNLRAMLAIAVRATEEEACVVTAPSAPLDVDFPPAVLEPGESVRLCVEARLGTQLVPSFQGALSPVTIVLTGMQVPS